MSQRRQHLGPVRIADLQVILAREDDQLGVGDSLVEVAQTRLPDVLDEVAHAGPGAGEVAVVEAGETGPFLRFGRRSASSRHGPGPATTPTARTRRGSAAAAATANGPPPDDPTTAYSSNPSRVARSATSRPT
ncbi:hypothetical protein, partial [Actinoplanes sp. NPDC051411]|uniref:hypothetical protein n=1 Tax=Actinoplanes sp. NPDC051411 TaxID=3155522 RepID=UPI0034385A24